MIFQNYQPGGYGNSVGNVLESSVCSLPEGGLSRPYDGHKMAFLALKGQLGVVFDCLAPNRIENDLKLNKNMVLRIILKNLPTLFSISYLKKEFFVFFIFLFNKNKYAYLSFCLCILLQLETPFVTVKNCNSSVPKGKVRCHAESHAVITSFVCPSPENWFRVRARTDTDDLQPPSGQHVNYDAANRRTGANNYK